MSTESNDKTTPASATPATPAAPASPASTGARPAGSGYTPRPAGSWAPRNPGYGSSGSRPAGSRPPMGAGAGPAGRGRPPMRRRVCRICLERQDHVDWKAVNFLRNFITERGKILSARATGTCGRCQRKVTRAIKRARTMALLPTSPL
jgi:small subunit ribosomal protein S18